MFFEFPTKDEWRKLEDNYPFEKLEISEDDFKYMVNSQGSREELTAVAEITIWRVHLQNRLIQTRWSYVLLMFHFSKGIPDDEWFKSPGKNSVSIEYYPHFKEEDHLVKAQFDYYADIFYYKLFSAWDTLGHLLNVIYELEIEQATFHKTVKKLKTVKPKLYGNLQGIVGSPSFEEMRELRHNITHNHLPGHIGSTVRRVSKNLVTFGGGSYTPSAQIKDNVIRSLDLFAATLDAIKEQSTIDYPS